MTRRRARRKEAAVQPAKGPATSRGLVLGLLALVGVGAAALWLFAGRGAGGAGVGSGGTAGSPLGGGDTCRSFPRFTATLNLGPRANIGTSVQGVTGLAIVDPDKPVD